MSDQNDKFMLPQDKKYVDRYKTLVLSNVKILSEIESIVKWGSIFIAGRFTNSTLLTEIAYSGSKLFELLNDCLLRGSLPQVSTQQENRFKLLLCIAENLEVVLEVGAQQLWGETGKWAIVATITLIKLIWKLILLLKYKMRMIESPAIPPLDRTSLSENNNTQETENFNHFSMQHQESTLLPNSGYLLRSINSTPPPHLRSFLPQPPPKNNTSVTSSPLPTSTKQFVAELLHIARPASHLGSMYLFGQQSWLPFTIAMGMDLSSLHLYSRARLTASEKEELTRRYRSLLLYLLRSPLYNRVTQSKLTSVLSAIGANVPLTHSITNSLIRLANHYNGVHAYSWMS